MHTGLKIAAEDAILTVTLKVLLMVVGVFFCVTATVRLHPYFFSPFPLYLLSTRTAAKISFAEPLQQTIPNIPPGAVLLLQGDHQCCSRWPIQLLGFCIFIYNTRTNPLWTYYLTL